MNDMHTRPGLLRRAWRRALDGDRPWGSVDVRPDRFGVTRYRMVVYPPGMNQTERRRVRVARGWPLWGVAAWIFCELVTTQLTGPWAALTMSTTAVVGTGLVAMVMAGEPRRLVRTMHAASMVGHHDPVSTAAVEKLKVFAGRLLDADDALRTGRIRPADHEMLWWRVYNEIASYSATPSADQPA